MDDHENIDDIFHKIVSKISHIEDPVDVLSRFEINRVIAGMNETSTYLGRALLEDEENYKFSKDAALMIRELTKLTNALSEILSRCDDPDCPYCEECPDCTDELMCDDCIESLREDDD